MNNTVKLSTLFDIFVGQIDNGTEYHILDSNNNKENVKMLRMGMFDSSNGILKNQIEILEKEKTILSKRQKARKVKEQKEMRVERCLQKNDYVICSRYTRSTPIVGYSMLETTFDQPLAISHHYIVLRPRVDLLNLTSGGAHVPFFHALLDALVEKIGSELNCHTSSPKVLSISTLKKYSFSYPKTYEGQDAIYQSYMKLKAKVEGAKSEFNQLRKGMASL